MRVYSEINIQNVLELKMYANIAGRTADFEELNSE